MFIRYFQVTITVSYACILLSCVGSDSSNERGSEKESRSGSNAVSGSGSSYYYELTTTTNGRHSGVSSVIKLYLSPDGKVRTEVWRAPARGTVMDAPLVVIGSVSTPQESTTLDDVNKTFTINHLDPHDLDPVQQIQSSVVKVGIEQIGTYKCVHARVLKSEDFGPLVHVADTIDLWRSDEVPFPTGSKSFLTLFQKRANGAMYSTATARQLGEMGCAGFPVKMETHTKSLVLIMLLTKVERKDVPRGFYEVPPGYKQDKE